MKHPAKQIPQAFFFACAFLAAFGLWTAAVCIFDVQAIGPDGSEVGFAACNAFFHRLTGVHWTLYTLTDWMGLLPIGIALGFALLGLVQLLQRKSICKVDRSILVLGGFYLLVLTVYLLFEKAAVNYRPVKIDGFLEVSYPSSTTLLALCVLPTAMMQLKSRLRHPVVRRVTLAVLALLTAFFVIGRFLSGVHWASDIFGGMLCGAGLDCLYFAVCEITKKQPQSTGEQISA